MHRVPELLLLLITISGCVHAQLPFQVNSRSSCGTKISLDTQSLTGIKRGDLSAPCSGNLYYNFDGYSAQLCGDEAYGLSNFAAERACYTLGVNFYRDTASFNSDKTRQMKLYKCVSYREQGADSAETSSEYSDDKVFAASQHIDVRQETGCTDERADPAAYDCFDTCYFQDPDDSQPSRNSDDSCGDHRAKFTITCTDINECVNGVNDHCTGPFDTSCTIRKACGNNTDCTNHAGSYECSCKGGYELRSGNDFDPYDLDEGCKDIDECKVSKCSPHAKCHNTPGSYLCWCKDGFTGDGITCTPIQCKPLPKLPNAQYQHPVAYSDYEFSDLVVYDCDVGHKVSVQNLPEILVNHYGYYTTDSLTLTCDEKGEWGPYPVPQCIPVDCGDPGVVLNADRDGMSFLYDQQVTYTCDKGYRPDTLTSANAVSFTRTCQADGKWTSATFCVDIDECEEEENTVCQEDEQNCINTHGSYLCLVGFPDTCELQEGLSLCKNGECEMNNGKAECVCNEGFKGLLCQIPTMSTALTLAIVAVVLVSVQMLCLLLVCCRRCLLHHRAASCAPDPCAPPPCGPVYGTRPYGPPKPANRFGRFGWPGLRY